MPLPQVAEVMAKEHKFFARYVWHSLGYVQG